MKEYKNAKMIFENIHEIKKEVRLLYGKDLTEYKKAFYSQKIHPNVLDWFWRYIWDDISYKTLKEAMHL